MLDKIFWCHFFSISNFILIILTIIKTVFFFKEIIKTVVERDFLFLLFCNFGDFTISKIEIDD